MSAAATPTELSPRVTCPSCERATELKGDLAGKRIGDSIRCAGCQSLVVLTRSRVRGDLPPPVQAGVLTRDEQREVAEALRRIKLRRVGNATRHVRLYPSWAVFLAGVQFYLSGILAGQNVTALGDPARGRRLQVLGILGYLAVGASFLGLALLAGDAIPRPVALGALLAVPLAFAAYFTRAQHASGVAAREAGARPAPVLLPLLVGLILAIAQAFAVWFLLLQLRGPL